MRITNIDIMRADGGWRPFSFLKVSTDEELIGWSEFVEGQWSPGLADIITSMGNSLIGEDPRRYSRISAICYAETRFAAGGLNHQSIAAIENACLDIAAKACNLPVYSLLGGPLRDEIKLYWSHCGSFRVAYPSIFEKILGKKPLEHLDDFYQLGKEAADRGFSAVKTNPIIFDKNNRPVLLNPGFVRQGLDFSRELDRSVKKAILDQFTAMKDGLGERGVLMLDFNFGFSPDSLLRLLKDIDCVDPAWVEFDLHNPRTLADIRAKSTAPVASLESVYGRRGYLPYLETGSVDLVIIDILWNGFVEGLRIADLAETFELNVVPHNFYGPVGDLISAHFCATVPGTSIMEIEADDVPWKYELLSMQPTIRDGKMVMPTGPGWGADVNEEKVKQYPWKGG